MKNAVKSALSKPLKRGVWTALSIGVSALLAVSTFLTVIPQTATTVYAAGTRKNMQLGYAVIGVNANTNSATTVYFGSQGDPLAWRVIGYNGNGIASTSGNAILLSSDVIVSNIQFSDNNNYYNNSTLHTNVNNILTNRFTGNEKADTVMLKRTLEGKENQTEAYAGGNSDYIRGGDLADQQLWPLSTAEAEGVDSGIRSINKLWWLRSPGGSTYNAANVGRTGYVYCNGDFVDYYEGVRPALNINLSSIILTSAAEGGKDPGTGGAGTLNEVAANTGTAWKLTLHDTSRDGDGKFTASAKSDATLEQAEDYTSWTVPVIYSGAQTGTNEHVSAILTDSTGVALYYGYIATNSAASTEGVNVTIPTGLAEGTYTLKIFNEQCNGDKKTDLSSAFHDIELTVTEAQQVATPTFFPPAGTYPDAQDVVIFCGTEGATIHYTTDGSTPTTSSPTYSDAINVECNMTIKAVAVKDGMTNSEIAEVTYTINIPGTVATPTFSPAEGTYTEAQNVSISCATEGATIYYTTDGSDPTSSSSVYSGPITIGDTTTIKAIAVKDGMTNSQVAEATYTIEEPPTEYQTITFDPNARDAGGKMDPQKIEKGKTEELKENKFTRVNYTFDNWNTKADGSGEKYADKASITPQGDMTLYAQWTENKPAPVPPVEEEYTVTVTVSPKKSGTATASVSSGKTGTKVTLKAVSKAGYKFKKWKVVSGGVDLADATKTKTTFAIKDADVKVKAIFEKIYEAPQPEIEPVDDDKIILAWWKVNEAEGYDIFMSRCNHGGKEISPKLVKTIEGNKTFQWTATGLKPNKSYKAYIKAFVTDKNGKKKYISKSPLMHVYTAGGNRTYTNAKSVKINTSDGKIKKGKLTLKLKETYKIKASVKKADKKKKLLPNSHVKTLRYRSSDPGVATVSSKGKITAKKKGKCKVYVYAHNGVNKTIKVTVK